MWGIHRTAASAVGRWHDRGLTKSRPTAPRPRRAWSLEWLEERTLLSPFTVTNLDDSGTGSLRQAIIDSNGTPGPNEIDFVAGLSGTITLTSGQLTIANNDVTIVGPGADVLKISGNNASRVFEYDAVTAAISGLTITEGLADQGAGIWNNGDLRIAGCRLRNNHSFAVETGSGGGIFNSGGELTVDSCTIEGNSARNGSIANFSGGDLKVVSSMIVGNTSYYGAGIDNNGSKLTIVSSTLSGNTAYLTAGGIGNYNGGDATVISCTIADNTAQGFEGGGIATGFFGGGTMTVQSSTSTATPPTKGAAFITGAPCRSPTPPSPTTRPHPLAVASPTMVARLRWSTSPSRTTPSRAVTTAARDWMPTAARRSCTIRSWLGTPVSVRPTTSLSTAGGRCLPQAYPT